MKKKLAILLISTACLSPAASAQNLLDNIFGNNSTIGNIVNGILSTSNLTISDICGQYKADGSAVTFKGESFLQKAGGVAAAGAIETKLNPYYQKWGFDKMELTIEQNGEFQMKIRGIYLKGTITQGKDQGSFIFNFTAFQKVKLGSMTAYIQKSVNSIDLMFDATKLKTFLGKLTKALPLSSLKTVGGILDSYDGLCVGWKLNKTGNVETQQPSYDAWGGLQSSPSASSSTQNQSESQPSKKSNTQEAVEGGLNALKNILGGKK